MSRDVAGWVAVVTGAASGMGLAMATTFARAGMGVMMADVDEARLRSRAANVAAEGYDVASRRCDVSRLEDNEALAAAALERFGKVNVFCANAGIGMSNPVWATSIDEWRWTIDVDLWGPIYGVKTFYPLIAEAGEGHLNATASMAGWLAGASLGAYNVAKHGVVALMASLARDLQVARSPITASVLCPGPVNTDIVNSARHRPLGAEGETTPAGDRFWANLTKSLAHGMDPAEVGPMVLDAIVNDKFWIFTHPDMIELAQHQLDRARGDRSILKF